MSDVLADLQALRALGQLAQATPPTPGVLYRHYDVARNLLYLGSSDVAMFRFRQAEHARNARWWRFVARIEHERVLPDRSAAYRAEFPAIKRERPIFNCWSRCNPRPQQACEAEYLSRNADVVDRWPRPRRQGSRLARQAEVRAMLAELGVFDGPTVPSARRSHAPAARHSVLDLGEYLMREHLSRGA